MSNWDISQERAFIENLLGQRVNFFLVFFSLVVAGAIASNSQAHLIIILIVGSIISWLLALPIFRAQKKLDLLLAKIYEDPSHPATIINKECDGKSKRKIIGYVAPIVCSTFLTLGAIFSLIGLLQYAK